MRGNCSLVTGIPGRSDNIRINGIIDRYLEHSRILIFANGGKEAYYIGSADWMPRNFDNRIEVMAPVHDTEIRRELKRIITYGLRDTFQGHTVDGTGRNLPWTLPEGCGEALRSSLPCMRIIGSRRSRPPCAEALPGAVGPDAGEEKKILISE